MRTNQILIWVAVGLAGVLVVLWTEPRVYPFGPSVWTISPGEAEVVALERLRDLGDPVVDPYVVTRLTTDPTLEHRLQLESDRVGNAVIEAGRLRERTVYWEVLVFERGAPPYEWTYRARVGLDGEVMALQLQIDDDSLPGAVDPETARAEADRFLAEQGFDLGRFGEPEARSRQLQQRTDLSLRYRHNELELGESYPYGVEVRYSGDRLSGYYFWFDDPGEEILEDRLRPFQFLVIGRNLVFLLLLPIVAVPFLRRYHAGEVGVRRGLQVGALVLGLATLVLVLTARHFSEGSQAGLFSRVQMSWVTGIWLLAFLFLPIALMCVLSWSVGESWCRERWGQKLAAFDALFQGRWTTATVARSALRGVAAGAALAGLLGLAALLAKQLGAWPAAALDYDSWRLSSPWSGVVTLGFLLVFSTFGALFGRLFLVSWATRRLGLVGGAGFAIVFGGLVCWGPTMMIYSLAWVLGLSVVSAAVLVALFLRFDLLTSLGAGLFAGVLQSAIPLVSAGDPWLQLQGSIALFGAALPLIVSARSLAGGEEFAYRYDDVPPHVRRIADRERQRVELETARRIQSSILPELPPQLAGVQLAHAYLPATEVGGDFYDVMALEDGRLAVAVGDVAGHGVSSGLVMSMARSALAVQVTFDPEVASVFTTLNRMVYQSARRRLLTTLCYLLLDADRRELFYASAGHLFPYRVTRDGKVEALESVSYPLGVRELLEVRVRSARIDSGDSLFLFSDGVVEGHGEGSDELFGFERLEASLKKHAGSNVAQLRDGVLADLKAFMGAGPLEDDLTVLVLEVP